MKLSSLAHLWALGAWGLPTAKTVCNDADAQHRELACVAGYADCFRQHPFVGGIAAVCAPGCHAVLVEAARLLSARCPHLVPDKATYTSYLFGAKVISILQWADEKAAELMCGPRYLGQPTQSTEQHPSGANGEDPSLAEAEPCDEPQEQEPCDEPQKQEPCDEPQEQEPCEEPQEHEPCDEPPEQEPCDEGSQVNEPVAPDGYGEGAKQDGYGSQEPPYEDSCLHALSLANTAILNGTPPACDACSVNIAKRYRDCPFSLPTLYNSAPAEPDLLLGGISDACLDAPTKP